MRKKLSLAKIDRKILFFLLLIILLGAFLRFYNLSGESFWLDEGATANVIKKYDAKQILNNTITLGQVLPEEYYLKGKYVYNDDMPVYYLSLNFWANLLGVSELSLRSFSSIFAILALIAIFYLTRYLYGDNVALLSTFLAAINLTLIAYSQEARQYSFLLFLSILSAFLLLKLLNEGKTSQLVLFVLVNVIIIYSHLPWAVFILFEGLYAVYMLSRGYFKEKKINYKVIAAFLILGLLCIFPLIRLIGTSVDMIHIYGRPDIKQFVELSIQLSSWIYPSLEMKAKINELSFNFSLAEWLLVFSVLMSALIMLIFFLKGIIEIAKNHSKNNNLFMPLMFFFPLTFALLVSLIHPTISIFQLNQIIYIIPAYVIIASVGISKFGSRKLVILLVISVSIMPLFSYYVNPDKPQFREAADILPKNQTIFITKESILPAFNYYYGTGKNYETLKNVVSIESVEALKNSVTGKDSFWVVFIFTKYSDPEGKIKKYLENNYRSLESKKLFDLELVHYAKK